MMLGNEAREIPSCLLALLQKSSDGAYAIFNQ